MNITRNKCSYSTSFNGCFELFPNSFRGHFTSLLAYSTLFTASLQTKYNSECKLLGNS